MDAEQFATEASNSPGSSSSSSSSASYSSSPRLPDFEIEAPIKKVGENGKIDSNISDDDENDEEDVEFVSGGEEFEEEPLVPAEESEKGDDSKSSFVDSSGLSSGIALPDARASTIDSDDDDDIVGGPKVGLEGDVEDGEDVLKESNISGDGSDKGLKIFGVSEPVESVGIGEVGVEEAPEPVVVVKRLGENGGLAALVNGSGGAKDSLEGIDGVLVGGEQDKVLEVPKFGLVGALSEETNVIEEDKGEDEVKTGSSTGLEVQENGKGVEEAASLDSGFDKVDPVIVEPVNEKLEEPDVMEQDGQGERVVDAGGSVTEENGVPKKVEDEGTQVKDGVDVEEGKMEDTTLGSGINEVEPVIVAPVTEKLREPDVMEQDGQGKGVVEVGGLVTEENGVPEKAEDEGTQVKDGVDVEEGKIEDTTLGSRINEVEPVVVELVAEKFGEPEGVELAGKGDAVVEAINVNLLASGAAVVGDVEENKLSEVKEDSLVDTPVNVDNVFDHISPDAEEPEKIAELNEPNGPETNAAVVGKGTDQNTSLVEEETSDVLAGDESTSVLQVKEKGEVVEEGINLGGGIDEVDPVVGSVTVEPVNEKLEESVVEAIHVNLLASGAAVIGDVEENKLSAIKEMDSLVVAPANVNNVYEQIRSDAEEPEKIAELAMSKIPETTKVKLNESNGLEKDASAVGKGDVQPTDVATKDVQDFQKMEASDDENQAADLTAKEKPPMEVDLRTDSDTEQSERVVDAAVKKEELLSSNKVDGGDGDGTKVHSYHAEPMSSDAMDNAESTNGDHIILNSQGEELEGNGNTADSSEMTSLSNSVDRPGEEDEEKENIEEEGKLGDPVGDEEDESMIFGSSEAAKQFLEGLERRSGVGSHSGESSQSHDHSQRVIDGQIVTDSEEEADTDGEDDGKEMFDSAALAALLKAATGTDTEDGSITITSKDGSKLFSVERPAGLGSSLRPKPPTSWSNRPNLFTPSTLSTRGETEINLSDEEKQKLEKLQQIRIKFLRLVQRLGYSPEDQIAAQVLYRLALVAGRQTNQLFSLDAAKRTAFQLEEEGKDDLNFSLDILVLGKTGVGKSSTINSIFGEAKSQIDAFGCGTAAIKEINGTVGGVKIRVFDTPGLKSSVLEQGYNRKVLSSVKKFTKKSPPDIVLYVDRLDTQTRDLNDFPMLKTITNTLGPSIWRSAIVTLTHAASAPPDGPTGNPLSYEVFVTQRSHIVQQSIGQAVGDLRMMSASSMNPISLVENHPSCRKNREGLKVLPNGQTWKPQLLFLCYSLKILSEASALSKPQDPFDHKKLFGLRVRPPPLPYLLSWLLQSRTHPKLLTDQSRNDVDSDIFDDEVDQEEEDEEEEEYDQLPPFRPLTKEQLKKLTREQRNAYFDEYEYRVKLLQKKQWKEMKKGNAGTDEMGAAEGDADEADNANDGMVSVPLPDMVLPHSFDGDSPAYRYRFLDPQSHLLTRPVLDTHGWDRDCGYDGVNIENRALAIKNQYPASIAVQITKDKKEFNIHLDSSVSAKHGENGSSMVGFDIQNVGKQLAYIVRAESKFKNHRRNKTTAGASVTFLGENIATGVKVEDQLALGKRFLLTGSTGTVRCKSDAAYGANLEVQLREADYPIGQDQSSLGLSLVKWRGDLALGANLQSQVTVGRGSKVTLRAGLNNKRSGQISVSLNSTEQLQLALIGIIPLARAIYKTLSQGAGAGGDNYSLY